MANQEHLEILKQGVEKWNKWRKEHVDIYPDLSDFNLTAFSNANLSNADLSNADLSNTNLSGTMLAFTNLSGANLQRANIINSILLRADFSGANLDRACFSFSNLRSANFTNAIHINRVIINGANLIEANLSNCNLSGANFSECNLSKANLSCANLTGVDLSRAVLIETNMRKATLTECSVFGISVWGVELEGAIQDSLVITLANEPTITVDNLEVAQFIYLLLNNSKIRDVIDTIARKAVLILGRFTPERKAVLDALREALRTHDYVPILFDFDKPSSRDLTETVSALAHLARFIIVDLTDPSSAPHEVATVIPHTVVPVQPLLSREPLMVDGMVVERREYAMFQDLRRRYDWVLPTLYYTDQAHLLATLQEQVIAPAEQKAQELEKR